MSFYPICIELEGKTALVVGGGRVAQRKVETLMKFGASIQIVSRKLTNKLKGLTEYVTKYLSCLNGRIRFRIIYVLTCTETAPVLRDVPEEYSIQRMDFPFSHVL